MWKDNNNNNNSQGWSSSQYDDYVSKHDFELM